MKYPVKYKKNTYVLKDIRRRSFFIGKELLLTALKTIRQNQKLNKNKKIKNWISIFYLNMNRLFFITKIKNFCIFSSKSKGVFTKLGGLSRMTAKTFLNSGSFFYLQRL